jgi:hypothetical protein
MFALLEGNLVSFIDHCILKFVFVSVIRHHERRFDGCEASKTHFPSLQDKNPKVVSEVLG